MFHFVDGERCKVRSFLLEVPATQNTNITTHSLVLYGLGSVNNKARIQPESVFAVVISSGKRAEYILHFAKCKSHLAWCQLFFDFF
jgi:uroporphyrinogen-III synthase